jgi:hypothetical protein
MLDGVWTVEDYQLAGMGWAAVITNGDSVITLHSERGWVDVYAGNYVDHNVIGCENEPAKIAGVINGQVT